MGQPRRIMAARIGDSMPCETLYACNLCDKVKKEELRALLYTLFVQYGDVIDIVHMRTAKMRGQAFIVFEETSSATAALRALQGFNFLGREVKLEFARSKSFATAKRDGTFKPCKRKLRRGRQQLRQLFNWLSAPTKQKMERKRRKSRHQHQQHQRKHRWRVPKSRTAFCLCRAFQGR